MKSNKALAWRSWLGVTISSCLLGVSYGAPSLLYDTILENTGCSATQFGLIFSAIGIGLLIGSLIAGRLIEKNLKLFPAIGALAPLMLYGSFWLSKSITVIIVCAFLYGVIFQFSANIYLAIVTNRWFHRGSAKMISIAFVCQNLAYMALIPVFSKIVLLVGGTSAALVLGLIFSGICLVCNVLLVGHFPEHYHLAPYSLGKAKAAEETVQEEADGYECALPLRKIATTPVILMLILSCFLLSMGTNMYFSNSSMLFQSLGMSYENAATCMSIASFGGMAINFLSGILVDRFGPKVGFSVLAARSSLM